MFDKKVLEQVISKTIAIEKRLWDRIETEQDLAKEWTAVQIVHQRQINKAAWYHYGNGSACVIDGTRRATEEELTDYIKSVL